MSAAWLRYLPAWISSRLEGRHTLQALISNAAWLLADRIFRLGVGIIIVVWLARYLGPDEFGVYSYAVAFVGLFSSVASMGIDTILVRELVNKEGRASELLGTALLLKIAGGTLAIILAVIAIAIVRPDDSQMLLLVVIAASGFVFQAGDVVDAWNQSRQNNRLSVLVRSGMATVGSCAKIGIILLEAPLEAFITVTVIETLLVSIAFLLQYRSKQNGFRWRLDLVLVKELLSLSWPFIFSGIAIALYMRIDQVMIGEMLTDADVGIYGAATRLSEVWYVLPTAAATAVTPKLLRTYAESNVQFMHHLGRFMSLLIVVAIFIALVVTLGSERLIQFVFGLQYLGASEILTIHIWSAVFVFIGLAATIWMIANGHSKFSLFQTVLGAALNVLLNFILIPKLGAVGAAWATLISYAFVNYFINAFFGFSRPLFSLITNALFLRPLFQSGKAQ